MVVWYALLLVAGYLAGSIPSAYLAAKWSRGIDLRQYGSGNVGVSNLLTVASKRWGVLVVVLDLGKGMLPVYIAAQIGLPVYQQITVGLATVAGHNWPVFLSFRGGRGLLTTMGVVFVLAPWLGLTLTALALAWIPFKQLALGSIVAMVLLPIFAWFLSGPFGIERSLPLTLGFIAALLLTIIRRLTAPRTALSASLRQRELVINRLLFDRDVRDRKAWITQAPSGAGPDKPSPSPEQGEGN